MPPASPARSLSALFFLVAAWLVPGLGHALAGWRPRGLLLGILIGGAFVTGLVLSDFEAVSRELHPYAFWAELCIGAGTLPMLQLDPAAPKVLPQHQHQGRDGRDAIQTYETVPRHNDTGVLFCAIAGLLNLLALFDLAERLFGRPAVAAPGGAQ